MVVEQNAPQDTIKTEPNTAKDTKNAAPAIVNNIGGFKGVVSVETARGNYPQGVDGYYAIFTDFNGNILSE